MARPLAPHRLAILRYLEANGPCSCIEIMRGTGLERKQVYPFLYQGGLRGLIADLQQMPQLEDFEDVNEYYREFNRAHMAPGQYVIGGRGRRVLTEQG